MIDQPSAEPRRILTIAIVLVPGFGMLAAATLHEVFFLLNREAGDVEIVWHTVSIDGQPVSSSSGRIQPVDRSIGLQSDYDLVIVLSATTNYKDRTIGRWLKDQARRGATLGAVTCGLWLLADAGLIGSRKCALHWADTESFRELYPKINLVSDLYVLDKGLITCCGAGAIVDMILSFLSDKVGVDCIISVAQALILERLRPVGEQQKASPGLRLRTRNPLVIATAELIDAGLNERNIVEKISGQLNVSSRWLQTIFKRDVGKTIKEYQAHCRVDRSKRLLNTTGFSISEIAVIVGFSDASHFSRVFSRLAGMAPSHYRARHSP